MVSFDYTVSDPLGIHARPAGMIAKLAKSLAPATVTIAKGGKTVKASQLMMLMSLAVKNGDTVTVAADGGDEAAALASMKEFFEANL